jgi:hypothetical protein
MYLEKPAISALLSALVPIELAEGLIDQYILVRQDLMSATLGRATPGKFVETYVQCLEAIENAGHYTARPDVDKYLVDIQARPSKLADGLRICGARLARAVYAFRNKRSVAHKNDVDPSLSDLQLMHAAMQWILTELVREAASGKMGEAAKLVDAIQMPIGSLVDDRGPKPLVVEHLPAHEEILVLLQSRLRVQ